MKKLAILAAIAFATPAFACPNSDHDDSSTTVKKEAAPKADQTKKTSDDTAKATPAKTDKAPAAKAAKDTQKKPDKVSSK